MFDFWEAEARERVDVEQLKALNIKWPNSGSRISHASAKLLLASGT